MLDLVDATQRAMFAAVSASGGIGIPGYEHVPANTQPPLWRIEGIDAEDASTKDRLAMRLTATFIIEYAGRSPTEMRGYANALFQRLHNKQLYAPMCTIGRLQWLDTNDGALGDGLNFDMRLRFTTIAQANQ